jgi:hypothetical protein
MAWNSVDGFAWFLAASRINDIGVESSLSGTVPSGHCDENTMEISSETIAQVGRDAPS